jgi:hypothetical protein
VTTDDISRLVISFLTGGLIVAFLNALFANRTERSKRRVEFLTKQLQSLYGPLYYFANLNQQLVALSAKLDNAYTTEYCEVNWSDDESTQRAIGEQASKTIDLINQYARIRNENNAKMVEILVSNWYLIDPEDAEMLQEFVTACIRHRTEVGSERLNTPLRIYRRVGPIISYQSTFVEKLRDAFEEKNAELSESRRIPHWAWPLLGRKSTARKEPDASMPPKDSSPSATPVVSGSPPR